MDGECQFQSIWGLPPLSTEERQGLIDRLYPWLGVDRSSRPVLLMMGLLGFGLFGAAVRAMAREEQIVLDAVGEGATKLNASQFGAIIVHGAGAAMAVFLAFQAGALVFTGDTNGSPFPQLLFVFLGAVFAEEVWGWGREALRGVLGRVRGAAGRLYGEKDEAHARAHAALKAARKRVQGRPASERHGLDASIKLLEKELDEAHREAGTALTDANTAWSEVSNAPNDASTQRWNTAYNRAMGEVREFIAEAQRIAEEAGKIAPGQPS